MALLSDENGEWTDRRGCGRSGAGQHRALRAIETPRQALAVVHGEKTGHGAMKYAEMAGMARRRAPDCRQQRGQRSGVALLTKRSPPFGPIGPHPVGWQSATGSAAGAALAGLICRSFAPPWRAAPNRGRARQPLRSALYGKAHLTSIIALAVTKRPLGESLALMAPRKSGRFHGDRVSGVGWLTLAVTSQ